MLSLENETAAVPPGEGSILVFNQANTDADANLSETADTRGGASMGFAERNDTI